MKFAYLRWMIRSSIIWIVLGTAIGLLMQLAYGVPALAWAFGLRSLHVHMLLVGGVIQMIAGVALWMFPRRAEEPQWPTSAQGWTLYAAFNGGTLLRSGCAPLQSASQLGFVGTTLGASLQAFAIGYFVVLVIPRVRGPRPR